MRRADELQLVREGLWCWQTYEPAVKCDVSSTALRVHGGILLIDPIPLELSALAELTENGTPLAVVLTSENHARAAGEYRERFRVPIYAHPAATPELGVAIDRELSEGETLFDHVTVITLPGAAMGEIALHCTSGVVVVGDALIHLEPNGLTFLPDKYCTDGAALRVSVQKLLRFEFDVLTFAHGLPLVGNARQRVATMLA